MTSEETPLLKAGGRLAQKVSTGEPSNISNDRRDDAYSYGTSAGTQGAAIAPDPQSLDAQRTDLDRDAEDDVRGTAASQTDDQRARTPSRTRFLIMMIGILSTYFIAMFDSTLMASIHPVITSYFNAANSASWLSTAFLLTSTSFMPMFGRLSDTFGRRSIYIGALIVFAVTTTWCASAKSMGSLIAARACAGLGAGGIMSLASIIINDLVPLENRGTYQAYINIFFGLGSAAGAGFGGLLSDFVGWRGTFGIQVPAILVVLGTALWTIPGDLGPNIAKHSNLSPLKALSGFDWLGSCILAFSVGSLILSLALGGNTFPWTHPVVVICLVASIVAAAVLLWAEQRARHPVMPPSLLFRRPQGNMIFANFCATAGFNTILFNLPLYFQVVKLDSPSVSGLRLGIPTAILTVFGVGTGFYITWSGRVKAPQVAGAIVMLTGSILLASIWHGIPTWLVVCFVVPIASGQGLMFPATSVGILATTAKDEYAVMTSVLALLRSLGTVIGVSVSSLVVQNVLLQQLALNVTGPDRHKIIHAVRKSVKAVYDLPAHQQRQVQISYEVTLLYTFASATAYFAMVNVLVLLIKLERLKKS